MRLAVKLSLLLALATLVQPLLAAMVTLPANDRMLRAQLEGLYKKTAEALAGEVNQALTDKFESLSLGASALKFSEYEADAREQALVLLQRQTQFAGVVCLFDERGEAVSPPVVFEDPQKMGKPEYEEWVKSSLAAFSANVPLEAALKARRAMGPVYVVANEEGRPVPRVVVALSVPGKEGKEWVLAVELSMSDLASRFGGEGTGGSNAFLVDGVGKVIAHSELEKVAAREDLSSHPLLSGNPSPAVVGASAVVPLVGWSVVVEQPADTALAPIRQQQRSTLTWMAVGLVGAVLVGFTTVRAVTGRIQRYRAAAAKVAAGELESAIEVKGRDELAQLGRSLNEMIQGLRERERLRRTFSRYVSDAVATRILSESSDLDLKGEQVEVTVLFIDVRDFTSYSERHTPREVVDLLNAYLQVIVRGVVAHDGVINKFIGDAVMAVFGVPKALPDPEKRAVASALEIRDRVRAFNEERRKAGLEVARFGIGVNTGAAIAGNLGTAERMEYTVIGDAVNVAQRLQSNAQENEVIISASTYERVKTAFSAQARGAVKVKGKEQPVEVYLLESARG